MERLLAEARGTDAPLDALVGPAIELADLLLRASRLEATRAERRAARSLAALTSDPEGKAFTTALADRAHRSADPRRAEDVLRHLLAVHGVPRYLSRFGRLKLRAFERLARVPSALVRLGIEREVRRETRGLILDAEPGALAAHLRARAHEGIAVNVNLLGEEVLGEGEALARVDAYRALAAHPDVEAVSVKVSGIDSQIDAYGFDAARARLAPRLASIVEAARAPTSGGRTRRVHLDMEAFADLELTVAVFLDVLDAPELADVGVGIALQAYLPDSLDVQERIVAAGRARVARGGAPARVRVVKGANLATERVSAQVRGLAVPIHRSKAEVDAAYKRMLDYGTRREHAEAVHLGVASHNLFDLALAMLLRAARGVEEHVELEMLEGMASATARAARRAGADLLLYAPVVEEDAFHAAVAYLVRRLDESTDPENFLPKSFDMEPGGEAFEVERAKFEASVRARDGVRRATYRDQDRRARPRALPLDAPFENEPDTDFALAHNRAWMAEALAATRAAPARRIAGTLAPGHAERVVIPGFDPSRPDVIPYEVALATAEDARFAVTRAAEAAPSWARTPPREREAALHRIAQELRHRRGRLVAAMVLDAGKRVVEADTEVSEAIDFAEHYLRSHRELTEDPALRLAPEGVVLVTPPWNFPLAIPAGGVLAALVAGNTVVLKPALETPLVARELADACHAAGLPDGVLELVIPDDDVASELVRDPRVGLAVLTGATSTGRLFRRMRPSLALRAETGGKNAMVVTALADRDLAIKNALRSAFSHAGQKCSATSLLVLEAEVYDDPAFRARLADATRSLVVGSAWEPDTFVTPLVREPEGPLLRALTTLDEGEEWLVPPRVDPSNPRLVHPAVKLGVAPGSFTYANELFGPVLGVMRARDLEHAIALADGTGYGLCASIQSLDEREQRAFADRIRAGNVYVNRGTTGAIVRRQPFGGWNASGFGPGAKAGGPGYVLELARASDGDPPAQRAAPTPAARAVLDAIAASSTDAALTGALASAAEAYEAAFDATYGRARELVRVLGQENVFRYAPHPSVVILALPGHDARALGRAALAAVTCAGTARVLAVGDARSSVLDALERADTSVAVERVAAPALAEAIARGDLPRVRAVGDAPPALVDAAGSSGAHLETAPVLRAPRAELPRYLLEQSVSIEANRFGALLPSLGLDGARARRRT